MKCENRAAILEKKEELMGTTTLAATLNTPMSELRPATMDRILVIEDDSALRKILQRLFSSEGYEVEVVPDSVAGLERLRQRPFSVSRRYAPKVHVADVTGERHKKWFGGCEYPSRLCPPWMLVRLGY